MYSAWGEKRFKEDVSLLEMMKSLLHEEVSDDTERDRIADEITKALVGKKISPKLLCKLRMTDFVTNFQGLGLEPGAYLRDIMSQHDLGRDAAQKRQAEEQTGPQGTAEDVESLLDKLHAGGRPAGGNMLGMKERIPPSLQGIDVDNLPPAQAVKILQRKFNDGAAGLFYLPAEQIHPVFCPTWANPTKSGSSDGKQVRYGSLAAFISSVITFGLTLVLVKKDGDSCDGEAWFNFGDWLNHIQVILQVVHEHSPGVAIDYERAARARWLHHLQFDPTKFDFKSAMSQIDAKLLKSILDKQAKKPAPTASLSAAPNQAQAKPRGDEICKNLKMYGSCRYGRDCRYRHTGIARVRSPVSHSPERKRRSKDDGKHDDRKRR